MEKATLLLKGQNIVNGQGDIRPFPCLVAARRKEGKIEGRWIPSENL